MQLQVFAERLGYSFSDEKLLGMALTHRSMGSRNNGRLEFLGDAVLGLCISERLFELFPDVEEGDLSRLRASLVNRETLADIASTLGLGDQLRLGGGELKSGGFRRGSILADALEAVIGAVYIDGGFLPARELVDRLYQEKLSSLPPPQELKDPKTRLQERLQGQGLSLPDYRVEQILGKEHEQQFRVLCSVSGSDLKGRGEGGSRRKAEQAAAAALLKRLDND